ncbi:hypothetical protein IQK56_03710 [Pseudomonas sp. MAFF 301449]|uniref:ATP-binding protein n=1 Tax=Pseudomonas cyclaminis TaxID=2781239 RepID=A0ABR9SMG6_9PSED|nr:hypothetical protein [Pseudomonas cyclaminis]MBE8590102.1 hypothetical protein [Pseudomonas cyclaminis]MBE8599284.1 hypothetical protein [Pseudomonas cyclaminis]
MANKPSKKGLKKNKKRSIDPKIYIAGHNSDPVDKILSLLGELDAENNAELIHQLASNKFLPRALVPIYHKKNYYNTYSTSKHLSKRNGIYWITGLLIHSANILKSFIALRDTYNTSLLSSDYTHAEQSLNELDSLCLSWWGMENRIHLKKEIKKGDTKELIKSYEAYFPNTDVKNKLGDLLLLSESNSIDFFALSIQERLSEYRNSGSDQAIGHANCVSLLTLPICYDHERNPDLANIYHYRNESIIDQYVLFKSAILEIYAAGNSIPPRLLPMVLKLANTINDEEILCVLGESTTPSTFVNSVVDCYTKGNYESVVQSIKNALNNKQTEIFGLIELYARACKYSNSEFSNSLFDSAASALSDIVSLDVSSREKIEYLNKLRLKFRNENWGKSLSFHLLSILQEVNEPKIIELTRCATKGMLKINTPKATFRDFTLKIEDILDVNEIPLHRAIRYNLKPQQIDSVERESFPILSDYIKQKSKDYINNENWSTLTTFIIKEYLNNKISFLFLPVGKACSEILELDNKDSESYISSIVVLDIYSQESSSVYDEQKTELFEEWLDLHNTHLPSEIFDGKELSPTDIYMLSNICTPNQLDNIATYEGNIDVIYERVTILNILISATKDPNGELAREKIRIIEDLFADKLRAKIEAGKLFVDVQAFTTHRKSFYQTLYEHVKGIRGGVALEEYENIQMTATSKDLLDLDKKTEGGVSLVAPTSEKTDGLSKILFNISRDFALNENYGLDKYLSAEIRHVVFEEQLRSCFDKTNLITVKENGDYLPNEFWRRKYKFVQNSMLDKLDDAFKDFSIATDKILKEVNNRFRVGTDFKKSGAYIFDFSPYYAHIVKLSKVVEKSNNFDEFFRGLIDFMWSLTDKFAKEAQALINDQLKENILLELNTLEQRITTIKSTVPMTELMQEIRNARSYFYNSVEIVLSWFRFVNADDADSYERLGVVVEAAVGSVDSFFRHKKVQIIFTQERTDLLLSFREARALFVALFTALENSFRYNFESKPITITHTKNNGFDLLNILNQADDAKFPEPDNFVSEQRRKWADPNSNLSREEGGTGLYKIHNLLLNSSPGFNFDISYSNKIFSAKVKLNHENFASGR